jgi:hypothetical protein
MARLMPTGSCWCGCGKELAVGSFFAPGHDKLAEARVIREVFGSVPAFIAAFGYAPEGARDVDKNLVDRALVATLGPLGEKLEDLHETLRRITRNQ